MQSQSGYGCGSTSMIKRKIKRQSVVDLRRSWASITYCDILKAQPPVQTDRERGAGGGTYGRHVMRCALKTVVLESLICWSTVK